MPRGSITLFRVAGIVLEVHPSFFLLPVVLAGVGFPDNGWTGILSNWWALVLVYTCVILHEFGHALVARRQGVPVERIVLLPVGGMALLGRLPRHPKTELLIVAAGPLVNFIIAGLCLILLGGWPADFDSADPFSFRPHDLLAFLFAANLLLGLFNLLPAFPMDGGRLLRATLALRYGYVRATWIALMAGRVVALLGIGAALGLAHPPLYMLALLFGFILLLGNLEYQYLLREEATLRPFP